MEIEEKINQVLDIYLARQLRRDHPWGEFDKAGRFSLAPRERASCCDGIRAPSRAYPLSLMTHARTLKHLARLYGVDYKACQMALRQRDKESV